MKKPRKRVRGTWGGRRKGAGRKRRAPRQRVAHRTRPQVTGRHPVMVTFRVKKGIRLRKRRSMRVIDRAFFAARERFGMRITHVNVQGNHIHLIAEAVSTEALSRGMQGLLVRLAKGLNNAMGRTGKVFDDRFHVHVLRTLKSVRNAVAYVVQNSKVHQFRMGVIGLTDELDPYSATPEAAVPPAASKPLVVRPKSRMLLTACLAPLMPRKKPSHFFDFRETSVPT